MWPYREFVLFLSGTAVIILAGGLFTDGAEGISEILRIPRLIVGLTIVSFATTAPELAVSTLASYSGAGGLALGNAVGSCIINIGLILGLSALFSPICFTPRILKAELLFLIPGLVILYFFSYDGFVSRGEGFVLFLILCGLYGFIIKRELSISVRKEGDGKREKFSEKGDRPGLPVTVLKFIAGGAGVVLAAKYIIIPSSLKIARFYGVPETVIGLTLVSLGTSLPELVTAVIAAVKKMGDLAAGNIIGANLLNIFWITGLSAIIRPLPVDRVTKNISFPAVLIITVLFWFFARTEYKIRRWEGALLLAGYLSFIVLLAVFL